MKNIAWKAAAYTVITMFLGACDSYKEPTTNEEWKVFCEAPDSLARIKAIANEAKRQNAGSTCAHAPWQKFVPGKPRTW